MKSVCSESHDESCVLGRSLKGQSRNDFSSWLRIGGSRITEDQKSQTPV